MLRNEFQSLIVLFNFDNSTEGTAIVSSMSLTSIVNNMWLIVHSSADIRENGFAERLPQEMFHGNNIQFDSQVYVLTGNLQNMKIS